MDDIHDKINLNPASIRYLPDEEEREALLDCHSGKFNRPTLTPLLNCCRKIHTNCEKHSV